MQGRHAVTVGPALGLLWLAALADLAAQQPVTAPPARSVSGVVRDAASGAGVVGAGVTLADGGRQVVTDQDGAFVLPAVPAGPAVLRVERFGYVALLVPVAVAAVMAPLEILLEPDPIVLEGIDVRARTGRAALSGVVLDAVSGEGIPWAALWLRGERRFSTNELGAFRLDRVAPGSYLLLAQRMGYEGLYVHAVVSPTSEPLVIRLEPDPVMLEGIVVVNDRLRSRRNAFPRLVRTFDEDRLRRSGASDVYGFLMYEALGSFQSPTLRQRVSWGVMGGDPTCPTTGVYIDDQYVLGGLDVLASYHPSQLYLVEVFGRGGQIRVYTHAYIEGQVRRPRMIEPADLPPPRLPAC